MVSSVFFIPVGMMLCAIAGICAYLAAPQQLLVPTPLSKPMGLGGSLLFAVAGTLFLSQVWSLVTAIFMLALMLMLVWSLMPLCAALVQSK